MINLRKFKKLIYPNNILSYFLFKIDDLNIRSGREVQDKEVSNYIKDNNKSKESISAVYRVKNGEEFIELSILSIASLVSEIIFIDNGSSDNTINIVYRLKNQLKNSVDIKIYQYSENTILAGEGYLEKVKKEPSKSLAKYYNYAFSLATKKYIIKCDAHYIFTPKGCSKIKKYIASNKYDVLYYSGIEIFGKEMGLEPFCFKNNDNYHFVDDLYYEKLTFKILGNIKVLRVPLFIHMKRLSYLKYTDENALKSKYEK